MSLLALAGPLGHVGAGQSMLFAGLFRSVLADVLITLQQSGLASAWRPSAPSTSP